MSTQNRQKKPGERQMPTKNMNRKQKDAVAQGFELLCDCVGVYEICYCPHPGILVDVGVYEIMKEKSPCFK